MSKKARKKCTGKEPISANKPTRVYIRAVSLTFFELLRKIFRPSFDIDFILIRFILNICFALCNHIWGWLSLPLPFSLRGLV